MVTNQKNDKESQINKVGHHWLSGGKRHFFSNYKESFAANAVKDDTEINTCLHISTERPVSSVIN